MLIQKYKLFSDGPTPITAESWRAKKTGIYNNFTLSFFLQKLSYFWLKFLNQIIPGILIILTSFSFCMCTKKQCILSTFFKRSSGVLQILFSEGKIFLICKKHLTDATEPTFHSARTKRGCRGRWILAGGEEIRSCNNYHRLKAIGTNSLAKWQ